MKKTFLDMQYYETYYYANIIENVLDDPFPYLRNLHSWHEDNEANLFLAPYPKWTPLHEFISFIISSVVEEEINDSTVEAIISDRREVWADRALKSYGFSSPGFRKWYKAVNETLEEASQDDLAAYYNELYTSGDLSSLVEQITNEVFFLLFANRLLLLKFHNYVAPIVQHLEYHWVPDELKRHLHCPGVLRRYDIPEWVKKAVYFRDRGMCALCSRDVSGLFQTQPERHYDHIVPLISGGLNDVTNMQLLCSECNLKKGKKSGRVSIRYEAWY